MTHRKGWMAAGILAALAAGAVGAQAPGKVEKSPEALMAEIDALRPAKPAWREIAWKSCLLDGLRESRATGKPVVLWVFIDRPVDDARC